VRVSQPFLQIGSGSPALMPKQSQQSLCRAQSLSVTELLAAARVAQLAERLGLDLADALAGDLEVLADLFEGVVALLADAEAHAQDLLLARRERLEHAAGLVGEVHVDDRVGARPRSCPR
jgi:hypothetical protein